MAQTVAYESWLNDTTERRKASPDLARVALGPLLIVGALVVLAALGISYRGGMMPQFWHAYLIAACYCTSLSLGGLFFVIVQHLTGARWGVVLRRLGEIIAMGIGVCGLLFIPIGLLLLSGDGNLYPWNAPGIMDPNAANFDSLLFLKRYYLDAPFFIARSAFFFVLWFLLARYFYGRSVKQDRALDNAPMAPLRSWSAPAMLLFALSINFAPMDWIMTLNPSWFSTIFGVYYFAGCAVAIFSLLAVLIWWLQSKDVLTKTITVEHRHDVGKLMFGFVFFWGYIAFSQFMLIWYADIPEETQWYAVRQISSSSTGISQFTALLFIFHLLIPFLGVISRFVRRQRGLLAAWGIYLLVMHWFDLFYMIAPAKMFETCPTVMQQVVLFAVTVGLLGVYAAGLLWIAAGNWLVPVRDPRLAESLAFENV